jgi:hypothetical protein
MFDGLIGIDKSKAEQESKINLLIKEIECRRKNIVKMEIELNVIRETVDSKLEEVF